VPASPVGATFQPAQQKRIGGAEDCGIRLVPHLESADGVRDVQPLMDGGYRGGEAEGAAKCGS
jgi:hypothetical protein